MPAPRDLFRKFNLNVEKAIDMIRIVSNFTTLDKVVNQGVTKEQLQTILESIQMVSKEVPLHSLNTQIAHFH